MDFLTSTGIIRPVDSLGRIVVPKELVTTMKYDTKQPLGIFMTDDEYIVLSSAKNVGVVRYLDELNRVVIPKEIRDRLGIAIKTPIEIFVSEDKNIVLKKYSEMCCICGSGEELYFVKKKKVCANCSDFIKNNL
ncbi:MAG TPA: AbrB/MazE/SpoVT family DNA-binding domain-containing protein [Defluviitaleaceae bacterium]|nr:AbrB/MazE/SpoVT family DNA-binding domain-containing protein [Defluviitaleaceae bacterium]